MPVYSWEEQSSGIKVETIRSVANIDVPPEPGVDYDPAQFPESPKWVRVLGGGTTWTQAPGYRKGGKGSRGGFVPKTSINRERTG